MKLHSLIFTLAISLTIQLQAQIGPSDKITLLFAGDAMSHSPQIKYALTDTGYTYTPCFLQVEPYIQVADYSIVNLETPLAGAPYAGYPNFSAPDEYALALKQAGFDLFLLANNHIEDKGKNGLERTIDCLTTNNIPYAGVYKNKEQRNIFYPFLKTLTNGIDSITIAIFNCTYDTNGNPVTPPNIVNAIDTTQITEDLKHLHTLRQPDQSIITIMCIHWGIEYQLTPSAEQKNIAQWLAEKGFDLIIGSHPHVVQPIDTITTTDNRHVPVFWSLGNMISNQRWRNSNGGIFAQIQISLRDKHITDIAYLPIYVHKGKYNNILQYHLLPTTALIDTIQRVNLPQADKDSLTNFHNLTIQRLHNARPLTTHP